MTRRSRLLALSVTVVALLIAPAAQAGGGFGVSGPAKPFQAGIGQRPDISVDTSGVAHVVWDETAGGADDPDPIHYCTVQPGGTACSSEKVLTPPLDAISRSTYVFTPTPGRVLVESYRCCDTNGVAGNYVFESTDGGQTFGPARRIGNIDHQSDAVFGPGEGISGASISEFQRMPLTGPAAATRAEFDAGFPVPTHSDIAIFGTGTPLQVMSDTDNTSFVVQTGGGSPNATNQWTSATPLTPPGGEPRMAGGHAGVVMLYRTGEPGERTLVARKFDGSAFGPPVKVSEQGDPIEFDLHADPVNGRFHAFWIANGESPNELRWAFSDDGLTWSKPQVVLAGDEADNAFHLQVAAGPDGNGFGVWDRNNDNDAIRVIELKPGAGVVQPSNGAADTPADSVTVGGQKLTLLAPGGCVNPGTKIKLRVTSKTKQKLSPKKRVKIVYVIFSVDKKKKKDKKAAFKATFATKGFKAPSTHKLRAKIRLKPAVGKGKKKTKTLKGSLTICG
jgi:hypothetical protein